MSTRTCTCPAAPPHRVTCPTVAALHRNAMMCPDGTILYPDGPDDAKLMMELHDARYIFGDGDVWVYDQHGQALT
jgi:hypothetical protein